MIKRFERRKSLSDETVACNLINGIRRYSRKSSKGKSICITPFYEDNSPVIIQTMIHYNIFTHNVNANGIIYWKKKSIAPRKNKKLDGKTQHGIDYLNQTRQRRKH